MTESREISDEVLDRLVDGELPEAERRVILMSLDAQPGEWRRCALAFLEAQTWKDALGDAVKVRPVKSQTVENTVASKMPKKSFAWQTLLAVAANFVVAFSLGTAFNWLGLNRPGKSLAVDNGSAVAAVQNSVAANRVEATNPDEPKAPDAIRLTFAGQDSEGQSVEVPVVNDARQLQSLLAGNSDLIPAYVRERIERSGHKIEQHRQLVPVELNDGRQVIVPVDQLDVRYVGGRNVQ